MPINFPIISISNPYPYYSYNGSIWKWYNDYWRCEQPNNIDHATIADVETGTENDAYATPYSLSKIVIPVGLMMAWPNNTPPPYWIESNGQSTTPYPALIPLYGSNVPDTRGCFIRGYDFGRGLDPGRILRSYQQDTVQQETGSIVGATCPTWVSATASGAMYQSGGAGNLMHSALIGGASKGMYFDNSRQVRTSTEVRVKSICMMWIIYIGA